MNPVLFIGLAMFFTGMFLSLSSTRKYLDFTNCKQARDMGFQGKIYFKPRERYDLEKLIRDIHRNPADPYHDKAVKLMKLKKRTMIIGFSGFFLIIIGSFLQGVMG
ncbi:hypothetical protein DENIS_3719 [Desulfonema ishimotonii]|uniref:DUF3899 domain-containing protein n=1 Tax=Desulfonema ishimotonii TaxID=45657 RepID=A0A401G0I4_9BACT|nr:hypothetical protein [Desulfonema ishimotonii]GBC62742.1 hypothetical protein DENIS_3719 [Desulfonema ishimotonii]